MNYPLKFKAAILEELHAPLKVEEIEFRGPLLKGQILVKMEFSGICGKQIDEIDGSHGPDKFLPHLLGHEGSGEVIQIGPDVSKVKKGDKVILHWMKGSGIQSETPSFFLNEKLINAGWVTTFNEYAVVSENRITITPDPKEMKLSALCGCVITTAMGVVSKQAKVSKEDDVLVYGCGGVGLCVIQTSFYYNPKTLIAVDINDKSLQIAKSLGASHLINTDKEDIISTTKKITNGKGASKVIVCTGNIKAIENAYRSTSIPGKCFLIGVPPKGEFIKVEANDIMHEKDLLGSLGGGIIPDIDIPECFCIQKSGKVDFKKLITSIDSLEDINLAIAKVRKGENGRCIIKF